MGGVNLSVGSTRTVTKASPAAVSFPSMPAGVSQISIAAALAFGGVWGWECIEQQGPMPLRSLNFRLDLE